MSTIQVTQILIHDNPAAFTDPFRFEVTFEALQGLEDDLEWRLTYVSPPSPLFFLIDHRSSITQTHIFFDVILAHVQVGSSESAEYDQLLDSVLVGPIPPGTNKFEFRCNAPDASKIPNKDLIGVTVILLEGYYRNVMFIRVGYYVSNEYIGSAPLLGAPGTKAEDDQGMDIENSEGEEDDDDEEEDEEENDTENKPVHMTEGAPAPSTRQIPVTEIRRNILADKPRVTCLPVDWGSAAAAAPKQF